MAADNDPADELIGRRYVTDFTVTDVVHGETVLLKRYGETYTMTLAELRTAIETGFIVEAGKES